MPVYCLLELLYLHRRHRYLYRVAESVVRLLHALPVANVVDGGGGSDDGVIQRVIVEITGNFLPRLEQEEALTGI